MSVSYLNEEQIDLLVKNYKLPKEKISEWHKNFLEYIEKNGRLNKKKFIQFYQELLPEKGDSEDFCKYVFKAFDIDNSGFIDFNEFILALSMSVSQNHQDRLEWMFNVYDINRDGFIDYSELKKIIRAIYSMLNINKNDKKSINLQIDNTFKQLDQNNDKMISKYEFVEGCLQDEFLMHFLSPDI